MSTPELERRVEPWAGESTLPSWWGVLFAADPDATVFTSPEWMRTWLEVYGPRFRGEWVRWERQGSVVAGVLLVRATVMKGLLPLRCLCVNATAEDDERPPLAEYNDVLSVPAHRHAVAADFAALLRARGWECLALRGYVPGSVLDLAAGLLSASFVRRDPRPAHYVDLRALGDAPYDSVLGANSASQVRRSVKLYEERSGPLVIERAADARQALLYLDAMTPLHNRRWETKGVEGSLGNPLRAQFHHALVPRMAEAGTLDFLRVRAGERDLGYLYNFVHRGKAFSFQSGFAYEDDSKLKPGMVCHRLAVEDYRRRGLREYDFLAGDARYKRSLANAERTLHWSTLYRDRAWLKALVWAHEARSRLAGRMANGGAA
jgi:GNAT acetyltransferase-like protein